MSWASLPYDFDGLDRPRPKVQGPKPAQSTRYVEAEAKAFRERMAEVTEAEKQRDLEKRRLATERTIAGNKAAIIREYTSRGLTPVYVEEGSTMPLSLPFILKLGWRIESDGLGRSWLVRPAAEVLNPPVPAPDGRGQQT